MLKPGKPLKLDGEITILVGQETTNIQVTDPLSRIVFLDIKLTPKQLSAALSRLSNTPCKMELYGLDKVGKNVISKPFSFVMPKHSYKDRIEIAREECAKLCPDGWIPDTYYGSKSSFFTKDQIEWAQTTIRKYE